MCDLPFNFTKDVTNITFIFGTSPNTKPVEKTVGGHGILCPPCPPPNCAHGGTGHHWPHAGDGHGATIWMNLLEFIKVLLLKVKQLCKPICAAGTLRCCFERYELVRTTARALCHEDIAIDE